MIIVKIKRKKRREPVREHIWTALSFWVPHSVSQPVIQSVTGFLIPHLPPIFCQPNLVNQFGFRMGADQSAGAG